MFSESNDAVNEGIWNWYSIFALSVNSMWKPCRRVRLLDGVHLIPEPRSVHIDIIRMNGDRVEFVNKSKMVFLKCSESSAFVDL